MSMGTCVSHEHLTRQRPSLGYVLKGIVGLSFLATMLFGAVTPFFHVDPSMAEHALVSVIGAVVGGALAYRR